MVSSGIVSLVTECSRVVPCVGYVSSCSWASVAVGTSVGGVDLQADYESWL